MYAPKPAQLSRCRHPVLCPSDSNTGFSLLGNILASVRNTTYDAALAQLVKLVNMSATSTSPPADLDNVAFGYEDGQQIPIQDLGFSNPAGGIWSTAADMAKLMRSIFREVPGQTALDPTTVRRWLSTRVYSNPMVVPGQRVSCRQTSECSLSS